MEEGLWRYSSSTAMKATILIQTRRAWFFYQPDGVHIPTAYVIGGFFADEDTWDDITQRWKVENQRAGVERFHAADINAFHGEFEGWTKDQHLSTPRPC